MSKHANPLIWPTADAPRPAHSAGWNSPGFLRDALLGNAPYAPGKHAKPFGKHHPATPVTYDAKGRTTPLTPPAIFLDVTA